MKNVNPHFLHTLLAPLVGLADDDDAVAAYASLQPNCEQGVRHVIREVIVPHSLTLSSRAIEKIKLAYRFYLSTPGQKWDRVFDSVLLPFYAPDDVRSFFVWVWEECFPGESYNLPDLESYIVNPDINEPLTV